MADYIRREQAREILLNHFEVGNAEQNAVVEDCVKLINSVPPVDVRPVVTCEKCKYNNACLTQMFVEDNSRVPFDRNTFFCADGVVDDES